MDRGEARARNSETLGRHEFSSCFAVLCIPLPLSLSLSQHLCSPGAQNKRTESGRKKTSDVRVTELPFIDSLFVPATTYLVKELGFTPSHNRMVSLYC